MNSRKRSDLHETVTGIKTPKGSMPVAEDVIRPGFHAEQNLAEDGKVRHVVGVNRDIAHAAGDEILFGEILLEFDAHDDPAPALDLPGIDQSAAWHKLALGYVGSGADNLGFEKPAGNRWQDHLRICPLDESLKSWATTPSVGARRES